MLSKVEGAWTKAIWIDFRVREAENLMTKVIWKWCRTGYFVGVECGGLCELEADNNLMV